MAKATPNSVTQASDKLHRQYDWEYAGKPRHTRRVEPLEKLIAKSRLLLKKASKLKGPRGREVEKLVRDRLALYRTERDAIAEARYVEPAVGQVHDQTLEVNRAVWVYRRRFAGQDRLSVDVGELRALVARLEEAEPKLRALLAEKRTLELSGTLNTVSTQLEVMKDELKEVVDARKRAAPADLTAGLAKRAAVLIDGYRVHFAGHARVTTEPARLRRMIAELEAVHAELARPEHASAPDSLRADIDAALTQWRGELPAIEEALAAASDRERFGALGSAANRIFELYGEHFAGQNRLTRNLRLMADLCDRLGGVLDQMVAGGVADPTNANNIGIVSERLRSYEQEFVKIAEAKAKERGDSADPLEGMIR